MENLDQIAGIIALTMGASWASGINLYATLFMLGWMGSTGNIDLPVELQVLENPLVLGAAGLMYGVEFFADKIPGVDTAWDSIHTFIRIPAGAMLAAAAVGDTNAAIELAAAIAGGGMAATTHIAKSGSRVLINTSPEPFTNWAASIGEDISVIGGLWLALNNPWLFLAALAAFILFMVWFLPKVWRGIKKVFRFIGRLFGAKDNKTEPPEQS
ncbi:MAG: DUF4126 domain-containing protein [Gammaproteobacteria bacterium]|nr:DUF4126 domain-containing protein [Gammaproteobacteria bacterium]